MGKKKTFKKEVEVVEKTIEDLVEETVEKVEETKEEVEIIDEPVSSVSAGAEFIKVEGKVGTFLSINGKTPVKINDKAEVRRLVEHYSATAQNVAPYTFIIKRV